MAFSKQPQQSTYQPKEVPLLYEDNHRLSSPTKDADLLNCYIELVKNKELGKQDYQITKRAGSTPYIPSVGASIVRGFHYNQDFQKLYYCVGSTMYIWNVATNTISSTLGGFFLSTIGEVGFCDYLYDTGVTVVIATDGTQLKQISSTDVTTPCTDPDLPVHRPVPVFLDGYLFLVKTDSSDIYNSDLNDPLAWTPGNFISAEITPDQTSYIAKLNNYLVVFGSGSIEYFWDAGNATGSPLQRNDTPVKFNGFLGGFAQNGQKIYFVGNNVESQPSVFMLEDFKIEEVGTPTVTRYLSSLAVNFVSGKCCITSIDGHTFYILNFVNVTYVMDIDSQIWTRWSYQQRGYFDARFAITGKAGNGLYSWFILEQDSTIYRLNSNLYQDGGINFTASGVTKNEYFDTYNQKTMHRLVIWADKPSSSATMQISWTDDDYQTYNTPRNIDLYQEVPDTHRLGRFRRRAFKWEWTQNQPIRIKKLEVELNMGQH